jgi:hypothetical protein
MHAFDADQTQLLTRTFDRAWHSVLRESAGKLTDVAAARELVAKRILLMAKRGERDEWRLTRAAVMYFRTQQATRESTKPRRTRNQSGSVTNVPDSSSTAASSR